MMLLIAGPLFLGLLFLGLPVGFVILAVSILLVLGNPGIMEIAFTQRVVLGTQSFPLLSIPLFILVGELMNVSGISTRVMGFAALLTRRMVGGLAQTNIVLSALLAGMSGSGNADAAMQAKILVPEMIKRGYPAPFSSVVTASSALIAPMIPPGICLILFGFVTNVSIGKMFMAGIVPGLLLAAALMVITYIIAKREGYEPAATTPSTESLWRAFVRASPAIALPVIIIAGIRFGVFTPTEAAAVAVLYVLIFCLAYGEVRRQDLTRALRAVVAATSAILLVLVASTAFSWVATFEQIPHRIGELTMNISQNPYGILAMIALLLMIIGMFIEGTALILILAPLFMPLVQQVGIDPIHYGIVFVFMIHFGGITPPVGIIMFTTCSITKVSIGDFSRAGIPFFLTIAAVAVLLILIPALSTFLPSL
jgi:tripartite ATP-independent transporter DctM subunit